MKRAKLPMWKTISMHLSCSVNGRTPTDKSSHTTVVFEENCRHTHIFEKNNIVLVKFPNVLFHIHVFKDEQYLGTPVLFFNPVVVCTFSVRSKKA